MTNSTNDSFFGFLDELEIGSLSNPPIKPNWLADLLFYRYNRSVKYNENGNMLILDEAIDWSNFWARFVCYLSFLIGHGFGIFFNFLLLYLSLVKSSKFLYKKIHCLFANLAFCNILLSTGFLVYTFIIDVYYDVDSFNTLLNLNVGSHKYAFWPLAKQIIHTELVDNISLVQSFILLLLSLDRYLSLFDNYSATIKNGITAWIVSILPYFLSVFVFDLQLMSMALGINTALIVRFACFLIPNPLSLVLAVCAVVRLVQRPTCVRRKKDDLSCAATLLFILLLQLIEKFGLFLELLQNNFNFEITMGSREDDLTLNIFLGYLYM
uniref:Uncharacterized protein n=1 Tax=Panagrolaimus sp. JU765 TaxID=591449 RepID=A0AC34R7S9_9BILA